jgi:hypothetical protein
MGYDHDYLSFNPRGPRTSDLHIHLERSEASFVLTAQTKNNRNGLKLMSNSSFNFRHLGKGCAKISYFDIRFKE